MSDIYANAVDSLRIGIEHFLKDPGYSSRKHAIITLFHSIELLLKERLARANSILIFRNLDGKLTDDSQTVGIKEALARLDNLGIGLPKEPQAVIEKLQKLRNRIEHHRYDQREADEEVISEALAFILFFVDDVLEERLERDISPETLRQIQGLVVERKDLYWIAVHRFEKWLRRTWPDWVPEQSDTPDTFEGTLDCPICRQSYLVMGYHDKPFCFHCNTSIDAAECKLCCRTYLVSEGCCS